MRIFAIVAVATFICLVMAANVLFALRLGATAQECVFWIGVAVASAAWTTGGMTVIAGQLEQGNRVRACAAGVLLCLALSYDCMAAYGLARQEQVHRTAEHTAHATRLEVAQRDRKALLAELAATPIASSAQAKAALEAVTVTPEQCRQVTGPNRLRKFQADRIRAACRARTAALTLQANAEHRKTLKTRLSALERDLSALEAETPAPDPRLELLPSYLVAWASVLLVTGGGLLCGFAIDRPKRPAPRQIDETPKTDITPAPDVPDTLPEPYQITADRLIRLARAAEPPKGLARDPAGYLRGTQRQLREAVDQPLSKVNKALRFLSSAGVIDLDTGGKGTAYRLAGAV